jgi:hypothetical protein
VAVGAAKLFVQSSLINTSSLDNIAVDGGSPSTVISIDNSTIVGSPSNIVFYIGNTGGVGTITNTSILATSAASAIDIVSGTTLNYAFISFTGNTSNIAGTGTYNPLNTLI